MGGNSLREKGVKDWWGVVPFQSHLGWFLLRIERARQIGQRRWQCQRDPEKKKMVR